MSTIILEAETRVDHGKGASRRLRRLENKIPAIIYGGEKKPQTLHLAHHKIVKALESESIYSSVFSLKIDGKSEQVILKDLQRHPYKPIVLHMDFQRVSAKDVLIRMVPLHFTNESKAPGFIEGGVVNHTMTQVEVRCQAKDLPEFIEVDLSQLQLDAVLHLTDIKLPKNVHFAVDPTDGDHNHPVVSIHVSRATVSDLAAEEAEVEAAEAEAAAAAEEKAAHDAPAKDAEHANEGDAE